MSVSKGILSEGWDMVRGFIRKIPLIIWGLAASFGILSAGVLVGYAQGIRTDVPMNPHQYLKEENIKLKTLVEEYDRLSGLYLYQAQDVNIALDRDMVQNNPEEVTAAIQNIDQQRGLINVQIGRVLELRKAAGFPELRYEDLPSTKN